MGTRRGSADYALLSGAKPICIVEANAGELDDAAAKQALSYARILDVPWAPVTNGVDIELYGAAFYTAEKVGDSLVMEISLLDDAMEICVDHLLHLTEDALSSEEVSELFRNMNEFQALREFLQANWDAILDNIAPFVESAWGKGSVDHGVLDACMESIYWEIELPPVAAVASHAGSLENRVCASDWDHRPELWRGGASWWESRTNK